MEFKITKLQFNCSVKTHIFYLILTVLLSFNMLLFYLMMLNHSRIIIHHSKAKISFPMKFIATPFGNFFFNTLLVKATVRFQKHKMKNKDKPKLRRNDECRLFVQSIPIII